MKFPSAKPLSEISCLYPWISLIVSLCTLPTPSKARCRRRRSFHRLYHLCSRNQVTHFLISAPFVKTNTLLLSHSLFIHLNKSLRNALALGSIAAGTTSNHPVSLLPHSPPAATCARFHCQATKETSPFNSFRVSTFVPRPAILDFALPDPTYIHSLLPSLKFTLLQFSIVLLSTVHSFQIFTLLPRR